MIHTSRSYISNRHLLQSIKDLCCFRMVFMCHEIPSLHSEGYVCVSVDFIGVGGGDDMLRNLFFSIWHSQMGSRHIKIYIISCRFCLDGVSYSLIVRASEVWSFAFESTCSERYLQVPDNETLYFTLIGNVRLLSVLDHYDFFKLRNLSTFSFIISFFLNIYSFCVNKINKINQFQNKYFKSIYRKL